MIHLWRSKNSRRLWCLLLPACLAWSCNKATVNFGKEALTEDPNILYIDTMSVLLSTFQTDSFTSWGDTLLVAGVYTDSLMGRFSARAYMQLDPPATNPVYGCSSCIFDSLVFLGRYYGTSLGDTTEDFTLSLSRLSTQMISGTTAMGYSSSAPPYEAALLSTVTISESRPSRQGELRMRLPDVLGRELYGMLQRNSDTVTQDDLFYKYFHGLTLSGAGAGERSLYYFSAQAPGNTTLVRLYFRENGSSPIPKSLDFGMTMDMFQFNHFQSDYSNTPLSAFSQGKREVIGIAQTGGKVFMNQHAGLFIHLDIPALLSLKELHPYVKVVKASLEISPPLSNYAPGSFLGLPPAMVVYSFDKENKVALSPLVYSDGSQQTGNLVVDYLYHQDTRYAYDLTAYVNGVLTTGLSAQYPFVLAAPGNTYENRLVLDGSSLKLKLYVLGL